jgi:hypothetical protein
MFTAFRGEGMSTAKVHRRPSTAQDKEVTGATDASETFASKSTMDKLNTGDDRMTTTPKVRFLAVSIGSRNDNVATTRVS